ncbi:MAG: triose-phosphate isomerase [Thermoplasmata archaeon]|nr:triose-phosphate isomerase [Thermoplasmata archaeon]
MTKPRQSRTFSSRSESSNSSTPTARSSSTATSTRSARARSGSGSPSPTEAPLGAPLFLLNLKAAPSALGAGALHIGQILARQGSARGVAVAIAPAAPDLGVLAAALPIPIVAQHVDAFDPGAHTGWVVAESLRASGVVGSILNHSEHRIGPEDIAQVVGRLHAVGLAAIVCAKDVEDARSLARTHPPYLAVEPPELIGGDRSVATARPEVVRGTVEAVREVSPNTRVLCGAGVHDRNDVRIALELGAHGVLVASAVTRAVDPAEAISELLAGYPERPRHAA